MAVAGLVAPEGEGVALGLAGTLLPVVAGLDGVVVPLVVVVVGVEVVLGLEDALDDVVAPGGWWLAAADDLGGATDLIIGFGTAEAIRLGLEAAAEAVTGDFLLALSRAWSLAIKNAMGSDGNSFTSLASISSSTALILCFSR